MWSNKFYGAVCQGLDNNLLGNWVINLYMSFWSNSRDVPTSRRWVNQDNSQQAVTSRRLNVATSARDLPSIIKSTKGSEFEGIGRRTNEGMEF